MLFSSFLIALVSACVYVCGFVAIHRYSSAKWFALEVLLGGAVGLLGLALGIVGLPRFRIEHYVSLYGMLWFCFFFVSGIFYASVSVTIVRYLSIQTGLAASIRDVFRDCIEVPFRERAQFLARVGQAEVIREAGDEFFRITAAGAHSAQRIRRIQRLFGFSATGYYSNHEDASVQPASGNARPAGFGQIALSVLIALSLAETLVTHGVRSSVRAGTTGIAATLIIGALLYWGTLGAAKRLFTSAAKDPRWWVLWAPLVAVLLLAQLAGLRFGTKTTASDWVVLGATIIAFAAALRAAPFRELWPVFVIWILGVYFCYRTGGTGLLHNEMADRYFPAYLTKRPWLDILFDPVIEFGDNRSRPLSLAFDFIDYRLVQASALLGRPHFKMLTYPAFMLACTGTAYWFFVRDLKLTKTLSLLLVMLFQSAPAVAFHSLYRSAKIGAALMVIVAFAAVYRYIMAAEGGLRIRAALPRLAWIWAACLMMPMFDELGTYSIGMLVAALLGYTIVRRSSMAVALLTTVTSTLFGAYAYRYGASANLYAWVNGAPLEDLYNIDGTLYERMSIKDMIATGIELTLDNFRFMFGNMSRGVAVAVLLLGAIICAVGYPIRWGRRWNAKPLKFATGVILFGILVLVIAEFCIMVHFHPAIAWPDVRRSYYVLPTLALFLMLAGVTTKVVCFGNRHVSQTVAVVLALCFVGNLDASKEHWKVIHTGHARSFFERSDIAVAVILMTTKYGYTLPPRAEIVADIILGKTGVK